LVDFMLQVYHAVSDRCDNCHYHRSIRSVV
jgi:hypothetical protein